MGIEGGSARKNPEDPSRRRAAKSHPAEIRKDAGETCTVVMPFRNPQRFGHDRTEIAVSDIPVILGSYRGFKAAMELGGFREYSETETTVRMPTEGGINQIVLTHGDFQRIGDVEFVKPHPGNITFIEMVAERYLMNRPIGWGNFLLLREDEGDDRTRLTLVDMQKKMSEVVSQYPFRRIAINPYSPYLPTD